MNLKWIVNIVVDFVEVTQTDMSTNVNSNINSDCMKVEVAWGAVDVRRNIESVLDLRLYSIGEVDMSGSGNSSYYPLRPTELSSCGVSCVGAGCCPRDFLFLSGERIDRAGHVQLARRV